MSKSYVDLGIATEVTREPPPIVNTDNQSGLNFK